MTSVRLVFFELGTKRAQEAQRRAHSSRTGRWARAACLCVQKRPSKSRNKPFPMTKFTVHADYEINKETVDPGGRLSCSVCHQAAYTTTPHHGDQK